MLIFDIGGNKGLFTDRCLEIYPNSTVIICEPNINLHQFLKNKYKNYKNIIMIDKILSDKDNEKIEFYINDTDTISSASKDWVANSRFSHEKNWKKTIYCETITIDTLIKLYGNPDIIKIDVEGYEDRVLYGLTKKQKEICFEWTEEQNLVLDNCCNHLKNIGYENFGFVLNSDEYLKKPEIFSSLENLNIKNTFTENKKISWGMVWVR